MMLPLSNILIFLEHYKYFVIFPVMVFEGPIITIISGFLVYLGFLNVFITYPLLVAGDLIGDSLYYAIGKYGSGFGWVKKLGTYLGYNKRSEEFLKNHFEKHTINTLLAAKISHGLGIPVQITAGIARVNFFKYISVELIATMPKTLFLLTIGFYIGSSYIKINDYLHFMALMAISIVVFIIFCIIFHKYVRSYFR